MDICTHLRMTVFILSHGIDLFLQRNQELLIISTEYRTKVPLRSELLFVTAILVLAIGYFMLEWHNGRAQMADFRVYYDAAHAITHSETVYGKAFGVSSGFYKYSPFACIPFIPFTWLPYTAASLLYYLIISTTIGLLALRIAAISGTDKVPLIASISACFLVDHLERELHLGNINLLLLVLLFTSFRLMIAGHSLRAGLLIGLTLLFKPHFMLLAPYLVVKKEWRVLAGAGTAIVAGLLIPAFGLGFAGNTVLLQQWLHAMQEHNVALYQSPNTIYGIINGFVPWTQWGNSLVAVVLIIVAFSFLLYMRSNHKNQKQGADRKRLTYLEYFTLVALVPNLVHTDTEHFMWSWPLIGLLIAQIREEIHTIRAKLQAILLFIAFIPFGINSPDIVGTNLQRLFDEGLLGCANLLIIALALTNTTKTTSLIRNL